jgi:hypothetical protein
MYTLSWDGSAPPRLLCDATLLPIRNYLGEETVMLRIEMKTSNVEASQDPGDDAPLLTSATQLVPRDPGVWHLLDRRNFN